MPLSMPYNDHWYIKMGDIEKPKERHILKFLLYLCRWQASTPILWGVLHFTGNTIPGTMWANFIGGCIFFFIDKQIFKGKDNYAKSNKTILH